MTKFSEVCNQYAGDSKEMGKENEQKNIVRKEKQMMKTLGEQIMMYTVSMGNQQQSCRQSKKIAVASLHIERLEKERSVKRAAVGYMSFRIKDDRGNRGEFEA